MLAPSRFGDASLLTTVDFCWLLLTCVHVDLYISYHGSRASVFNDFGGATLLRGAPVDFLFFAKITLPDFANVADFCENHYFFNMSNIGFFSFLQCFENAAR